ncbi:hypothetical protein [Sphingomonas sp. PAMC 26605]|uniref:hypothetical protein n=1 Tax=Sphingomonas sp. PAMC 26605 TaxID=1112214 RepID=UPI0012F47A93|nr:hypothetical protein [Sphingomonas sp. PAMC 26605]
MAGNRLLADLQTINEEIGHGALELERLVRLADYPGGLLDAVRLRFSRALRRPLQLLDGVITPQLRSSTDAADKPALIAYRRLLSAYHEAAAHHVARWPSTKVATDWGGHRRSVSEMLSRLRERVEAERRDIVPVLLRQDPAGTAPLTI